MLASFIRKGLFVVLCCLIVSSVKAETLSVVAAGGADCSTSGTSNCTLQSALTQAQNNSDPLNTLNLAAGVYEGSFTYDSATSASAHDLVIHGAASSSTIIYSSVGTGFDVHSNHSVTLQSIGFGSAELGSVGAGVYAYDTDGVSGDTFDIEIDSCRFENNQGSGLAVWQHVLSGSLLVHDSSFVNNSNATPAASELSSNLGGGGMRLLMTASSDINIHDNLLSGNSTTNDNYDNAKGGGIYLDYFAPAGSVAIADNTFESNTASAGGGAVFTFNPTNANFDLTGNTFDSNNATHSYGAFMLQPLGNGDINVSGNTISNNTTDFLSPGFRIETSHPGLFNFSSNIISNNDGNLYSGGEILFIVAGPSGAVFADNLIVGNSGLNGGTATGGLNVFSSVNEDFYFVNNTVADNQGQSLGGLSVSLTADAIMMLYYTLTIIFFQIIQTPTYRFRLMV